MISQPAFMAKPDAVWSEEEKKQFKDYEKRVKELNEEKDKYRKVRRANKELIYSTIPRVLFQYIFKLIVLDFLSVFSSLGIVFQLKYSREFGKVGGYKFKELEQFKTKRTFFNVSFF